MENIDLTPRCSECCGDRRMAELTGSGGLDLVSKVWSTGYSMRFFGIKTAMQLATTEANKQGAGQDVHSTTVRVSEQSGN